jgi:transcriptional regulator with XRE-family HTH domain
MLTASGNDWCVVKVIARFGTVTNVDDVDGRPSSVLAVQLKAARAARGLTVQQLAQRCAEIGAHDLTATMLYNIESGRPDKAGNRRRFVTVDELLILAVALEVAPVHLLVPLEDQASYEVTTGRTVQASLARDFVRGVHPLDGMDMRSFYSWVPKREFMQVAYKGGASTVTFSTRPGETDADES